MQNRTHTCNELRLANVGEKVKISGWMGNVRMVGSNFAFVVVRDFYGTTQVVIEDGCQLALERLYFICHILFFVSINIISHSEIMSDRTFKHFRRKLFFNIRFKSMIENICNTFSQSQECVAENIQALLYA